MKPAHLREAATVHYLIPFETQVDNVDPLQPPEREDTYIYMYLQEKYRQRGVYPLALRHKIASVPFVPPRWDIDAWSLPGTPFGNLVAEKEGVSTVQNPTSDQMLRRIR